MLLVNNSFAAVTTSFTVVKMIRLLPTLICFNFSLAIKAFSIVSKCLCAKQKLPGLYFFTVG